MTNDQVIHLQNENAMMRALLKQIAEEYGDRSGYGSGLLKIDKQKSFLIQQSMMYARIGGEEEPK